MTMVSVGRMVYPEERALGASGNSSMIVQTLTFDSSTDRVAVMFKARVAMTITDISFLTGTVTSGPTVKVQVETVSNGRPSGTAWATNTSVNIAVSGASTWQSGTLTSSASISAGDEVAIVITYVSGTANFQIGYYNLLLAMRSFPVALQDTGAGTWSPQFVELCMIIEDSGTPIFQPGVLPFSGNNLTGFDNADSPDEYAMQFVPPMKCRVSGVLVGMTGVAAGADFKVFLWGNDGASDTEATALASISVDGDLAPNTTQEGPFELYFATPVTLTAGSTYHVGVRAQTATANGVGVITWNLAGTSIPSGAISASPMGADCYLKTRTWTAIDPGTVGAWTSDQTKVPHFRLIIDQLDDGTGSGGILVHPGMVGGMRG